MGCIGDYISTFKTVVVTVLAVAFVMLAIALGPNVPAALATAHAILTNNDVKLNQLCPAVLHGS
jgi:hypothetical protein